MRKKIDVNEPISLTLKNDYAFKKIFGSEENKDILTEFICLVTGMEEKDFEDLTIENSELQPDFFDQKKGILDIRINLKNGQKIDIEMQQIWEPYYIKRTVFYWGELYREDFQKGFEYEELNKCIVINIVQKHFLLNNKLHSSYRIQEKENCTPLTDVLEIHFLNLSKIPKEKRNLLEDWLLFIDTEKEEVRNMIAEKNPKLKKANEQMKDFYSVEEQRAMYLAAKKAACDRASMLGSSFRKGKKQGEKRGIAKGIKKGIKKGIIRTVKNMKAENCDYEFISKITGLSIREIENI